MPKDSIANVSYLVAIDRSLLTGRVGHLSGTYMALLLSGIDIDIVLGRG